MSANYDSACGRDPVTSGCCQSTSTSLVRPDLVKHGYGDASNLAHNAYIKSRIAAGENIYHFGFGQSPFPVLEEACDALGRHASRNEYTHVQGIPELRQAICKFHECFDNITFDPDDIVVAPGSKELILLLITVFNGDILLNSPSWTTYRPQALLAGKTPVVIESSEKVNWKVTPEALEKAMNSDAIANKDGHKLLIFINPCNPTGTCYTEDELIALSHVFRKHNIIVVSDEIYARLHYEGKHVCLAKVYPEGTVLSTGLSKWASAGGWRLGYHIYPKELSPLLNTVRSAGSHSYSCAPVPMQCAVAELLQKVDVCNDYIQHCSRILKAVADFTARTLRQVGVSVSPSCGGYYCFPNFEVIRSALASRGADTGKKMCDLFLKEVSVALLPGGPDHLRPASELTVRLCYVCFDGKVAQQESRRLGLDTYIGDEFVETHCTPVFKGIHVLKDFVARLKSEQSST